MLYPRQKNIWKTHQMSIGLVVKASITMLIKLRNNYKATAFFLFSARENFSGTEKY